MRPSAPKPLVIQMEDVAIGTMRERGTLVVEHADWLVHAGDFWVIGGLQGAGKSDFLMLTGGLMAPCHGCYRLYGHEMPIFEGSRLKERLRLGLVFDGGHLLNHLTVRENIALPVCYHQNLTSVQAGRVVEPLLEAMELKPYASCTPGALGLTWQKRAGLARALALEPEILLVDNPLGGLDPCHQRWWLDFLAQLSRGHALSGQRPLTLVVTGADLRPWKDRACQFAILRNRRFLVLGTWAHVEKAKSALVHELMTGTPPPRGLSQDPVNQHDLAHDDRSEPEPDEPFA